MKVRAGLARVWDVFLWSRAAIWIGALAVPLVIAAVPDPDTQRPLVLEIVEGEATPLAVWAKWDAISLLGIAEYGYDFYDGVEAFYPLYPGVVALLGRMLGGEFVLAAVLVSAGAALAAFVLLDQLGTRLLGEEAARRAVVLLAVFPTSLFLTAAYSEGLFLALSLAAFLAAERRQFAAAGVLAGLAWLARPLGVALLLPLALIAWRSGSGWRAVAKLAPAPLLFLAYPAVLWQQVGEPLAFRDAEESWGRELSWLGPLKGAWDGARAAWGGLLQLTVGSADDPYWTTVAPDRAAVFNIEFAAYLVLFTALTVVAWRRLGAPYGLYAAVSLAIPLSLPQPTFPLFSLPRFGLVVFPFFLALAALTERRPRAATALVGVSAVLLGVNVVRWALDHFVA